MVSPVINMPNPLGKAWPMSGRPTQLFCQHSGETPLRGGFAQSLTHASNTDPSYQASWHSFVDPIARVRQIPWYLGAWTQGVANQFAIGVEIAGYAAFSRAQWLTPEGLKQMENLAHEWVYYWRTEKANGNTIELRWLEQWEVQAVLNGNRDIKGFCTHGQIEPATRYDPGPNFPYDILMNRIKALVGNAPAPKPVEEFTMADAKDVIAYVRAMTVGGYNWDGVKHPGGFLVVEETQRRVSALPNAIWQDTKVARGGKQVSALQDMADGTSAALRVEKKLDAFIALVTRSLQAQGVSQKDILTSLGEIDAELEQVQVTCAPAPKALEAPKKVVQA